MALARKVLEYFVNLRSSSLAGNLNDILNADSKLCNVCFFLR